MYGDYAQTSLRESEVGRKGTAPMRAEITVLLLVATTYMTLYGQSSGPTPADQSKIIALDILECRGRCDAPAATAAMPRTRT